MRKSAAFALFMLAASPASAQVVEKFPGASEPATVVGSYQGRTLFGGVRVTLPLPSLSTVAGGSVATANTFQAVLPQNLARRGCLIVNTGSTAMSIGIGSTPTAATSIPLAPGASFGCGAGGVVVADQLSVTSGTAGNTFVVISQ